ncbi:hypothetical protein IJT93_07730, partial [bacterium]|nr:hypothetical protein [bacterium]
EEIVADSQFLPCFNKGHFSPRYRNIYCQYYAVCRNKNQDEQHLFATPSAAQNLSGKDPSPDGSG